MKISISYTTNFKTSFYVNFKNFKLFRSKTKSKIISRNFFLFLLLLKYTNENKFYLDTVVFVKPFFKKLLTVLRAPYRHKLSRHQFMLCRYSILFNITFKLKTLKFNNFSEISIFLKNTKKFYI